MSICGQPRPAMRKGERRIVENRLRRHAKLMQKYQAEGFTKQSASRKAFDEINGISADDLIDADALADRLEGEGRFEIYREKSDGPRSAKIWLTESERDLIVEALREKYQRT